MTELTNFLDKYRDHNDKFESLFTVVIFNMKNDDLLEKLSHQLRLINTIKDNKRRKYLNDRLFSFKQYFIDNKDRTKNGETVITGIYLVHKSNIEEFDFSKDQSLAKVLTDFNFDQYTFKSNNYFEIDFLKSLFLDTSYYHVIHIKNNELKHTYLNSTKKKLFKQLNQKSIDVIQYIKDNLTPDNWCLIHGTVKNIKLDPKYKNYFVINNSLRDEEILDTFKNEEMKGNHLKLEEALKYLNIESTIHRVAFGEEIKTKISNYEIKTLFTNNENLQKIRKEFTSDYLNFEVILIEPLKRAIGAPIDESDTGYKLKQLYTGILGITYY